MSAVEIYQWVVSEKIVSVLGTVHHVVNGALLRKLCAFGCAFEIQYAFKKQYTFGKQCHTLEKPLG